MGPDRLMQPAWKVHLGVTGVVTAAIKGLTWSDADGSIPLKVRLSRPMTSLDVWWWIKVGAHTIGWSFAQGRGAYHKSSRVTFSATYWQNEMILFCGNAAFKDKRKNNSSIIIGAMVFVVFSAYSGCHEVSSLETVISQLAGHDPKVGRGAVLMGRGSMGKFQFFKKK